jgi:recA bacterial DNA recombination protein
VALPSSNLDDALVARLRLVPASRLQHEPSRARLATGIAVLDGELGGGWPPAALSELVGRRSAGRTSVLYASLAAAIARGQVVALVDAAGGFDPRSAEMAGISLPRLLWIRASARTLLPAADMLIAAGGFGVVAIDFGERPARVPAPAWLRLKHSAEKQGTAVLLTAPFRLAGAAARAAVVMRDAQPRFAAAAGPLLVGLETRAHLERALGTHAHASPANEPSLRFWAHPR